MSLLPQLCAAILILLCLSALYSASEMAITSTSKVRMEAVAEEHLFLTPLVEWVNRDRYKAISAILIGNNLVNIAASAVATALATVLLKEHGVALAVSVMSLLIIVFGEVLPKCVAMAKGEQFLIFVLPAVRLTSWLFTPFIWCMTGLVNLASRLSGVDLSLKDPFVTKEEIEQVVKIGEASGAIEESERRMIDGVISFDETRVSEIMVSRTRMDLLEAGRTVDEALLSIQQLGHSRVPIYKDTPDNIIGIVHVKDLLASLHSGKTSEPVTSVMRKPLFVPETLKVPSLFKIMQTRRIHMAVVVDEYGGTAGLVTLEDLLEEIVGEIQDEYDKEEQPIVPLKDGAWKVQASVSLEELNYAIGSDFECDEVDTVGGFLLDKYGGFPRKDDKLIVGDWLFVVADAGSHRVNSVIIRKNVAKEKIVEN